MVKPIIKGLEYVVDTLGNKIGALPNTRKSITAFHASPKQIVGDFKFTLQRNTYSDGS